MYEKSVIRKECQVPFYYPTKYYSETFDATNKLIKRDEHVFAGGLLVATIEYTLVGNTLTPKTYYHLSDQQNSTQVTTDTAGAVTELTDYYAYGNQRQDTQTTGSTFTEQRKYIGQYADTATTGLDYLNARYYNATYGRFVSEDPMFWGSQNLNDPQSLNSYSYANNNPIVLSDPSGKCIEDFCIGELALTAPIWYPALVSATGAVMSFSAAGVTAVGTYILAQRQMQQVAMKEKSFEQLAGQPSGGGGPYGPTPKWDKLGPVLKAVTIVGSISFVGVGAAMLMNGKSPSDMDDVSNTNNLNPNPISPLNLPYTPTNQPPIYTSPAGVNSKQAQQQNYTQQSTSSYNNPSSQIVNLMAQVAMLQQILNLQTQINQIKYNSK